MTSFSSQESSGEPSVPKAHEEDNVHRVELQGKSLVLIGTAHVSKKSADHVAQIIETERPDAVCVELCRGRYETLMRNGMSRQINLLDLVAGKGRGVLWLMLWYLQKRVGDRLGVRPGAEIVRAVEAAKAAGARINPIDRDIGVTLDRVWSLMGIKARMALAAQVVLSLKSLDNLREQDIENLKHEATLEKALAEMGRSHPVLRQVVVDERDQYMAEGIAATAGQKIVAVVGAAHVPGILRAWRSSAGSRKFVGSPDAA